MKKIFLAIVVLAAITASISAQTTKELYSQTLNNCRLPLPDGFGGLHGGYSCTSLDANLRRLYTNVQRTEYYIADNDDASLDCPILKLSLRIPSSDYKLMGFSIGGLNSFTDVLAIVNKDGQILDAIEVGISAYAIPLCECEITEDFKIKTYGLVATDKKRSDNMSDFKTANMYREDNVYKIVKGRFEVIGYQKYMSKVYTRNELSGYGNRDYCIRNGKETPVR